MSSAVGTALITGASSGIGAVYADRLAKRGYDLVLVARNVERLEKLAAQLRGSGVQVEVMRADLTNADDIARVASRLTGDDITFFLNNAGNAVPGPLIDADPAKLADMVTLNVVAPARLVRAVAPGTVRRGRGTIVNLASVAGLTNDRPGVGVLYGATKAFMLSLSEGLQTEIDQSGVRVQAVLPGVTRTEIWERGGLDVNNLPAEIVMDVQDMVDASLAGLDSGEAVTIPALPEVNDWEKFKAARAALYPNLSHRQPAARYVQG